MKVSTCSFFAKMTVIGLFVLSAFQGINAQPRQFFSEIPLFKNGEFGYGCFRIPAVIRAPNGHLLAFAEGRVNGCTDYGDLDIVLRRSEDDGRTWKPLEIVVDNGELQAGNMVPIVDLLDPAYPEGRIFLIYNTGNNHEGEVRKGKGLREVWFITSHDHGQTWSAPVNITTSVHRPNRPDFNPAYVFREDWRSYANAPGHGLQLTRGAHKGRLFVPANHSVGEPLDHFNEYRSHGFFSDDHGKTWRLGASLDIPSSNEAIAAQLSDGRLMLNCRHQNGESRRRIVALSSDGGLSWDSTFFDSTLISPVCQASLLQYETPDGQTALLFSNPADTTSRRNMTVRISYDDGKTWPRSRSVRSSNSAYSDLVIQRDGLVGLLYEHGDGGGIHYAHFNYNWLIGDSP